MFDLNEADNIKKLKKFDKLLFPHAFQHQHEIVPFVAQFLLVQAFAAINPYQIAKTFITFSI